MDGHPYVIDDYFGQKGILSILTILIIHDVMKGKLILGLLSILSLGVISISTTSCTITYNPDYNSPNTDEDSSTDSDENSSTDSDEDNLIINVEEDTTEYTEGLEFKLSEDETSYIVSDYNGSSTDVVIPSLYENLPVRTIGGGAFYACNKLNSVIIPYSVITIDDSAFAYCNSLSSITMGSNVAIFGKASFRACSALSTIKLPITIKSIGFNATCECRSLTTVYYAGSQAQWNKVRVDSGNYELNHATMIYDYKD